MSPGALMGQGEIGISTVVDAHPRFWCELVVWGLCADRHLPGQKRVYAVGGIPTGVERFLDQTGIELRHAETLMAHAPHCNKLIPFLDSEGFDNQIVTDCDVFATGDFTTFFRDDQVRLPPNNHGVPPLPLFQSIFDRLGLEMDPEPGLSIFAGTGGNLETFALNVSAGVICIPSRLRGFAEIWRAQAEWFADHADVLGPYNGHVDQISFAVAAARNALPFSHFPAQANAILHLLPHIRTLYAMHLTSGHIPAFPHSFDENRHLRTEGLPDDLHPQIEEFNALADEARGILARIPETADFHGNLLNPDYRRS